MGGEEPVNVIVEVADVEGALADVAVPRGLTHKPARQTCVGCRLAERRHSRHNTGLFTIKPGVYGDLVTIDQFRMVEGFGWLWRRCSGMSDFFGAPIPMLL